MPISKTSGCKLLVTDAYGVYDNHYESWIVYHSRKNDPGEVNYSSSDFL